MWSGWSWIDIDIVVGMIACVTVGAVLCFTVAVMGEDALTVVWVPENRGYPIITCSVRN